MQVVPRWHPEFDVARLKLDPAYNIMAGARLLAASKRAGFDLVEAASRYNAGSQANGKPHPSSSSPWGVREDVPYIASVVRGHNWFIRHVEIRRGLVLAGGMGLAFVALGAGAALAWADVRGWFEGDA